jgi:peptidyl-tRNA hydrolase, PTH1 family
VRAIVGLGNYGPAYRHTRHNAGWMVLDELERRWRASMPVVARHSKVARATVDGEDVLLVRPQTYMNESGKAVRALVEKDGLGVTDLMVVYDDLDLAAGRVRVRASGSAGGHRGILSIQAHLRDMARMLPRIEPVDGQVPFPRVKIGIGRPPSGIDPVEYVLKPFLPDDLTVMEPAFVMAADAVAGWLRDGIDATMNRYNANDAPRPPRPPRPPRVPVADGVPVTNVDAAAAPDGPAPNSLRPEAPAPRD